MDHIILFGLLNVRMYFSAEFYPLSVWSDASFPPATLSCLQSLFREIHSPFAEGNA